MCVCVKAHGYAVIYVFVQVFVYLLLSDIKPRLFVPYVFLEVCIVFSQLLGHLPAVTFAFYTCETSLFDQHKNTQIFCMYLICISGQQLTRSRFVVLFCFVFLNIIFCHQTKHFIG